MVKVPDDPKQEQFLAAAIKGLVSSVPLFGGLVSEVGDLYLNPAIARRQAWEHELSFAVTCIQERLNRLPHELIESELFCSLVMQSTGIAITTHLPEKRQALRNILICAAHPDIHEDMLTRFVQYIGELTPTHIALLRVLRQQGAAFPNAFPDIGFFYKLSCEAGVLLEKSAFRSFVRDLENRFLLTLGDTLDFEEFRSGRDFLEASGSTLKPAVVTDLGHAFLDHIDLS